MTLVSYANIMGSFMRQAYIYIHTYTYIMNVKSPGIDPWVAPCFSIPK